MTVALIVAAGSGGRLGAGGPKALVELSGKALYWWSLYALQATAEQLKDPETKPNILITELTQLKDVIAFTMLVLILICRPICCECCRGMIPTCRRAEPKPAN